MFYEAQEKVIYLFDDYSAKVSEAKGKAKHGNGMKIITSKQMFQRLPIGFAQVKAGKTYYLETVKLYILYIQQKKLLNMFKTI